MLEKLRWIFCDEDRPVSRCEELLCHAVLALALGLWLGVMATSEWTPWAQRLYEAIVRA